MNDEVSPARIALKWGLITGLVLIIYSVVLYTLDLGTNGWLSIIIYVILIAGLVQAMREFRAVNAGFIAYGEGVGLGALLSAIAGFLSSAFSIFYTTIIDPGFQERMFGQMREKLEADGNIPDEQIDQMMEMSERFQSPGLQFVFGLLWIVFIGVVFSLVVAALIRRNRANPFE